MFSITYYSPCIRIPMDNRSQKRKYTYTVIFAVYLAFLLYFLFFSDVFGRTAVHTDYRYNLIPFTEIKRFWSLGLRLLFLLNVIGNIAIFMPFGYLIPRVAKENSWRIPRFGLTTVYALMFSLFVELLQLLTKVGVFDVDDIILNVTGAVLGYLLHCIIKGISERING